MLRPDCRGSTAPARPLPPGTGKASCTLRHEATSSLVSFSSSPVSLSYLCSRPGKLAAFPASLNVPDLQRPRPFDRGAIVGADPAAVGIDQRTVGELLDHETDNRFAENAYFIVACTWSDAIDILPLLEKHRRDTGDEVKIRQRERRKYGRVKNRRKLIHSDFGRRRVQRNHCHRALRIYPKPGGTAFRVAGPDGRTHL